MPRLSIRPKYLKRIPLHELQCCPSNAASVISNIQSNSAANPSPCRFNSTRFCLALKNNSEIFWPNPSHRPEGGVRLPCAFAALDARAGATAPSICSKQNRSGSTTQSGPWSALGTCFPSEFCLTRTALQGYIFVGPISRSNCEKCFAANSRAPPASFKNTPLMSLFVKTITIGTFPPFKPFLI